MNVCADVGDADGNRPVAYGGEGVADGIKLRAVHEPGERLRVGDSFDRQQADGATVGIPSGNQLEAEGCRTDRERGGGDKLTTTDCLHEGIIVTMVTPWLLK